MKRTLFRSAARLVLPALASLAALTAIRPWSRSMMLRAAAPEASAFASAFAFSVANRPSTSAASLVPVAKRDENFAGLGAFAGADDAAGFEEGDHLATSLPTTSSGRE